MDENVGEEMLELNEKWKSEGGYEINFQYNNGRWEIK